MLLELHVAQHARDAMIPALPPLYVIASCGVVHGNNADVAMRIKHEATQLVVVRLMLVPVTPPVASVTRNL